jgi:hypothetical protein
LSSLIFLGAAHTVVLKPCSDHVNTPQVGRTTFAKVFTALWQQNEASDSYGIDGETAEVLAASRRGSGDDDFRQKLLVI